VNVALRIGAFVGLLALIFAAAALAGGALDPNANEADGGMENEMSRTHDDASGGADTQAAAVSVPGLAVADGGYRLVAERTRFQRGTATLRFAIVDETGATVSDFVVEHERLMHLILVRRDFEGFQHLHPRQLEDGSWAAKARLDRPGAYRMFADFATAESPVTLGADLFVGGAFDPRPLPEPRRRADAGDGYEVTIDAGPSGATEFVVYRDGRELDSVEPYLGADGHLVALREGDLGFLHTHPEGEAGGPIEFGVEYPSPGRYRLFLQFKHRGSLHTAAFTQEVDDERH
jgi:hypothetical protein